MALDELSKIKPLLKDYVEKSSKSVELQWDPKVTTYQLPFDPYAIKEKERCAHYFLQIASIDTTELVSRSENARALMIYIHNALGNDQFKQGQTENFQNIIQEIDNFCKLGSSKEKIPEVLNQVNTYVNNIEGANLPKYAEKFVNPAEMVKDIGQNVPYMGGQHLDHAWMYLRWMVRPYPDLNIFSNFSPKHLKIPLTSLVRNVAFCLGLCSTRTADWSNPQKVAQEREQITRFALDLFPEDPAIVDYPFYVLGRWIKDQNLSIYLLRTFLKFWQGIYRKIGKPPIAFDIASRYESSFEQDVRAELEKLEFIFSFEPNIFLLPESSGIPRYTPDFVLPQCRKKGKIVILEPHGIWTSREKRVVTLGRHTFTVWVLPDKISLEELRFVNKMRTFRENYREVYYLVLIVQSSVRERVERDYPDIYDEIIEGKDLPKMVFDLKKMNS